MIVRQRTRLKVEEARFFLDKLKENQSNVIEHLAGEQPSVPPFLWYLSAFVSAARSVPWVMHSEYHSITGWERWYASEEQLEEEQELLNSFKELRRPDTRV